MQIYRGPNTHFSLDGLEPSTEYQVRVCAVRESCDGSAMDILGPFSPGTHFTTCAPEPPRKTTVQELDHRSSEPRQWTDQQWAAVIVICFVVLAILLAFVVNQVMTYMGYSTSVSASSSSPSPPKTNWGHFCFCFFFCICLGGWSLLAYFWSTRWRPTFGWRLQECAGSR